MIPEPKLEAFRDVVRYADALEAADVLPTYARGPALSMAISGEYLIGQALHDLTLAAERRRRGMSELHALQDALDVIEHYRLLERFDVRGG